MPLEAAAKSPRDLPNSRRRKPPVRLVVLALLPLWSSGCIQMAALWTNMTGGDVIDPEYVLSKGPLLVLIDDRNSLITQPTAMRELHKGIADRFLEYRVNSRVVPFIEWQRLQQSDKGYDKMTIREIGAKLGADQVLYIRVDRFTLHDEPGAPLFKGDFAVRVKVVSTARQNDVRLWPRERSGRRVSATTEPEFSDGDKSASEVTEELAQQLSHKIAEFFYEHREFAE